MIRTSIRVCALVLCSSALLLAGCSGSRDDTLNTQNIGRSDAAAIVDEDAEIDAEVEGDADGGEDAGEELVVTEVEDAGEVTDVTVIIEVALCGNGQLDPDEECDQGASNSNTAVGACRLNCHRAGCGDGVVDQGEACDDGPNNSDTTANACRADCQRARCGDGVVDQDEQCDSADARSDTTPGACRISCRSARCGDGVVDTTEGCDDGNQVDTDACRNSCRAANCGNGTMDPGEQCDDGNAANTDECRDTCQRPSCGDGIVDSGEECDDGNSVNNDGCRMCRRGCRGPEGCSDGQFCNGTERCVDGQCMAALRPANADDGIACTDDACVEASDSFTHTPNDARCMASAVSCGDVDGAPTRISPSARCVAGSGCVVTSTNTACPDRPSACGRLGSRRVLVTYEPACNPDAMSCADAQATTEDCGPLEGSCSRDGIHTPPGDCDVGDLTCAPRATQDCSRESWSCTANSVSARLTSGTCDPEGGCGTATGDPVRCDDPPDTCSNGTRRVWTPTCGSSGCGDADFDDQPCPGTARTACGALGPNGQDAEQDYAPACADGATCARSTLPTGNARVCRPAAASACRAGANGPEQVNYSPLCANATSCTRTGRESGPIPCNASPGSTCRANAAGVAQRTYRVASCDTTNTACLPDGRPVTEDCQDIPPSCANERTEVRAINQCLADGACATQNVVCGRQAPFCSSDRGSVIRYTGACVGTSCVAETQEQCLPASCGGTVGAAPRFCTAGVCRINADGTAACNQTCTPCAAGCELTPAGARTGNFCPGCGMDARGNPICLPCTANRQCQALTTGVAGGTVNPNLGGTVSPGTVLPGAGLLSQ